MVASGIRAERTPPGRPGTVPRRAGTDGKTGDGMADPPDTADPHPPGPGTAAPAAPPGGRGRPTVIGEFQDAVTVRAVFLVVGVAVIQLAFITSYVGAFHRPVPHRLPVAVVAPPDERARLVAALNGIAGAPLEAAAVPSVAAGTGELLRRSVYGVLVVAPGSSGARLIEASAGSVSAAQALTDVFDAVGAALHRSVTVHDIRPPAPGDRNGLTSFYLTIGWIVGGYLVASILGISNGSRPANPQRATVRLLVIAVYALVTGYLGALVVGPLLHALPGPTWSLALLGALLVFAAGAFAMALQVIAGTIGIGITIVVFVVLGNPSAGGAYGWPLLPTFWRVIGPWLPSGAGTAAARGIAYFGGVAIATDLLVIAAYGVVGILAVYVVLVDVGHQLVRLPDRARRRAVEAGG